MEIEKYLKKFDDHPKMFKTFTLILFAVVIVMSIVFSKAKREKISHDYKIMSKIIKITVQESLRNPYLKTPEEENGE